MVIFNKKLCKMIILNILLLNLKKNKSLKDYNQILTKN